MSYETVTCEVVWIASYWFSSNGAIGQRVHLGTYETAWAAEAALEEAGLIYTYNDHADRFEWKSACCTGYITRMLKEIV